MPSRFASLIIEYIKTLPPWQKILASSAFKNTPLLLEEQQEIEVALKRLKNDLGLDDSLAGEDIIQEMGRLKTQTLLPPSISTKLSQVKNCTNINALPSDQTLKFSPKLTVIYGENGSGKSGYSRILNSAFYSRGDKVILPNILHPKQTHKEPQATFVFDVNGRQITLNFPDDLQRLEFKEFASFDSKTVIAHLEGSNELYVMPQELAFFEKLTHLVTNVKQKLAKEAQEKINIPNTFLSFFEGESSIRTQIENISSETDIESLEILIEEPNLLCQKIKEEEEKYSELKRTDPGKKFHELCKIREQLKSLKSQFIEIFKIFYNKEYHHAAKNSIEFFLLAQKENQQSGVNLFKTELLKTVGSPHWKNFILNTTSLIEEESKELNREFPTKGDYCPLCLQSLTDEALALFQKYFIFLKSESEKKLNHTNEKINTLILENEQIVLPSILIKTKLNFWLEDHHKSIHEKLQTTIESFSTYRDYLNKALLDRDLAKFPLFYSVDVLSILEDLEIILDSEIGKFEQENFNKQRLEKEILIRELRHKHILIINYDKIIFYIKELKWAKKAALESKKISTHTITGKQKSIFEEYFNKQYKQYFYKEAKELEVNFQIEVKTEGRKGKACRKLEILSYSPSEILSEGEQKVLALADFLTEIYICNIKGGLIFDDPVNSLDHERKRNIAKRLVVESHKRQVIIFTHDINFLNDLCDEADKQGIKEKEDLFCHWISKIDNNVGIISLDHKRELESDYKEPTRAMQSLKEAKEENNPQKREKISKQGFDYLRQTYEAFIIYRLFGGTVTRFNRRINYGKFKTDVYCTKEFITDVSQKLEYCSGFVNSHLASNDSIKASPELLEKEISYFQDLKTKFTSEKNKLSSVKIKTV